MADNFVRDGSGSIRYSKVREGGRTIIRDKAGRLLGWIRDGKTYDKGGKLVAHGEDPSAVVE